MLSSRIASRPRFFPAHLWRVLWLGLCLALAGRAARAQGITILEQPTSHIVNGQFTSLSFLAVGNPLPSYQWQYELAGTSGFVPVPLSSRYRGINAFQLYIDDVRADLNGARFRCIATRGTTTLISDIATLTVAPQRIRSLGVRQRVPAEGVAATLSIDGTRSRTLLILGVGPGLFFLQTPGLLEDPELVMENASGDVVTSNDNWGGGANIADAIQQTGATRLVRSTRDAALLATFPPGAYTIRLRGKDATVGLAQLEIYDVTEETYALPDSRISHIGYRGPVTTAEPLTVGMAMSGTQLNTLLVRASGLQAGDSAALTNPSLAAYEGTKFLAENDDWNQAAVGAAMTAVGAFPFAPGSKDAALIASPSANANRLEFRVAGGTNAAGTVYLEVFDRGVTGSRVPFFAPAARSDSVLPGGSLTLQASANGTGALAYQWRRNGVPIPGATASTYTIRNATANDAGNYDAIVTNSGGSARSSAHRVAVFVPGPPVIVSQPIALSLKPGESGSLSVSATSNFPVSYQWHKDGVPIPGATGATLALANVGPAAAGAYSVVVTNSGGSVVSSATTVAVRDGKLINFSVRAMAGAGDQTLIVGFAIVGTNNPLVYLRGVGPTLAQFGVTGALPDPQLRLYRQPDVELSSNDDWGGGPSLWTAFRELGAFPLPTDSKDAALVASLPAGAYSAQIGAAGGTGVAILEAYELDRQNTPASRFTNLSARSQVGTGENILVAGFAISGTTPRRLLVRATGPALAQFGLSGLLARPQLKLYSGSTVVAENAGWSASPEAAAIAAATTQVGAFPLAPASLDAALLVNLQPGSYTVHVSGANDTIGVALLEAYDLP